MLEKYLLLKLGIVPDQIKIYFVLNSFHANLEKM